MNCRDFRTAHLDYADRTLSAKRFAEAQTHLESCFDCARFDALVRRSLMLVHSLPPIAPDPRFDPRLAARQARARGAARPDGRRFLLTPAGVATAASIAFTAGLLSAPFLVHRPAEPLASLPPVVALAAPPVPAPLAAIITVPEYAPSMRVDFLTGAPAGTPLWSAASLLGEAPARFATAQLTSAVPAR